MDWREHIVELVLAKQKLNDIDRKGLWEYRLPRLAATEEQVVACEAVLGERLSDQYRGFLLCAGGWPAFFQTVDLFGPEDFSGGATRSYAEGMLGYLEDEVLAEAGFARQDLFPIASSREEMDLFVMTRLRTSSPGMVIWFAGREIERFAGFEEFFSAVVQYTRNEIVRLQGK